MRNLQAEVGSIGWVEKLLCGAVRRAVCLLCESHLAGREALPPEARKREVYCVLC